MPPDEESQVLTGLDCLKVNIEAAISLSDRIKTSFGPRGMDKIIISEDGDMTITNDGAKFVSSVDVNNEAVKMMADLSKSQDAVAGDGTTGVLLMCGAMLKQALALLQKNISPRTVMDGFSSATRLVIDYLHSISEKAFEESAENLVESPLLLSAVKTALSSKVLNQDKEHFAKLAIETIIKVADFKRKDIDLEQIKILPKVGYTMDKSRLIEGVVLEKTFSHPQMPASVENPKIAVLTCPFEPPKMKTKHKFELENVEAYKDLQRYEVEYFNKMIKSIKDSGANVVMCQWGFDDEANHMLLRENLPAVRWLGGPDIELVSIATNSNIVPRFESLTSDKIGSCKKISTISFDEEDNDQALLLEGCPVSKTVSVLLHATNKHLLDEVERSFHDAICVAKNIIFDNKVLYGGGSAEMRAHLFLEEYIEKQSTKSNNQKPFLEHLVCLKAFMKTLLEIPTILAENGLGSGAENALEHVSQVIAKLRASKNSEWIGIDALGTGEHDMKKIGVVENLNQKCQQFNLANDLVKQLIKIDSIRVIGYL